MFREKLKRRSIGNYFAKAPQKQRGKDYERALRFLKKRFGKLIEKTAPSAPYSIVATTAVDPDPMQKALGSVLAQRMEQSLAHYQFIGRN